MMLLRPPSRTVERCRALPSHSRCVAVAFALQCRRPQPAASAVACAARVRRAALRAVHVQPVQAAAKREQAPPPPPPPAADYALVFGASWAGLLAYAALWAPNQTPARDAYFLEKLVGLGVDGLPINAVFFALFNLMGVWPAVYAALLTPAGRSGRGVPAWPFATASFAAGAFALLPFFALWTPPTERVALPSAAELESGGLSTALPRALESRVVAALLLAATAGLGLKAATAGDAAWVEFARLFRESKLVHVTTIDFCTLTLCAPLWVLNDAQVRRYESPALLPLALLPLLGPVLYLSLRPRAE